MNRSVLRLSLLVAGGVLIVILIFAMTTEDADQNALLRGISQLLRAFGAIARIL